MDEAGSLKRATPHLRANIGESLKNAGEVGRKISEMAAAVNLRLFGPFPAPAAATVNPPLGPEASIEEIFSDGMRTIRSAQEETGATLQEILGRL